MSIQERLGIISDDSKVGRVVSRRDWPNVGYWEPIGDEALQLAHFAQRCGGAHGSDPTSGSPRLEALKETSKGSGSEELRCNVTALHRFCYRTTWPGRLALSREVTIEGPADYDIQRDPKYNVPPHDGRSPILIEVMELPYGTYDRVSGPGTDDATVVTKVTFQKQGPTPWVVPDRFEVESFFSWSGSECPCCEKESLPAG